MVVGLLIAMLWVLCAGVAAVIAQGKGRSVGGFAMAGLLLGVVGVVWAACAGSAGNRGRLTARRQAPRPEPPTIYRH